METADEQTDRTTDSSKAISPPSFFERGHKYRSPTTYHSKDITKVNVFNNVGETAWSRLQGSICLMPREKSCHKEHSYEISKP
jgi:hypothetical protein